MLDWLTGLFGSAEDAWKSAAARFANVVQQLDAAENQHLAVRNIAIELGDLPAWDALQDKVLYTKQAVNEVADAMRSSSQWFQQTFGLSALNALPLVPIAVITASISAMVSLVYALHSYNDNIQQKWSYINSRPDLTPQQAIDVLESEGSGIGLEGSVKSIATWLVVGGVLLVALPHLLDVKKK